jgi:ribosome production factor 2
MDKKAPQTHENPKTTLFVAGQKTSHILKLVTADLRMLKKPFVQSFLKKNDIHPFEDASCKSKAHGDSEQTNC